MSSTTADSLPKIGITHGDINGIGYEIIMKALADNKIMEICTPIVFGSGKVASYHKKMLDIGDFSFQFIKKPEQASAKKPNLINIVENEIKVDIGESTQIAGEMSELALNMAVACLKAGSIDAIVTAPINKKNIQSDTFNYTGHTEFFADKFSSGKAIMMMVNENVKLGFVTHHIPVNDISKTISKELILEKIRTLHESLVVDFASTNPTIAVLALNPHAGDNGLIGNEEQEKIVPAIQQAFDEKINAFGPFPADGFFASGQYKKFDAVLAMYHDQGMLPFKLLSFDTGVNFTAGLPIVRTSPAHGTAYEIAGKNQASSQSLRSAVYLACDIVKNRKIHNSYSENSLKR